MRVLHSRAADAATALVLFAAGVAELVLLEQRRGPLALGIVAVAVACTAFGIRRVRPVLATAIFVATTVAQAVWLTSPADIVISFFGLLLLPYAGGAYASLRGGLFCLVSCVALVIVVEASLDGVELAEILFPSVLCSASWAAGRTVRSRTHLAAELHEAAVRAGEARALEAEHAVAAERRRIAREMHDVVAHSISVMVVQAGGARRIMDRDLSRAVGAAAQIERTGREAMFEMRRLLGVLAPHEDAAARAPQPGLDALPALAARAREAGLPVHLAEEGERRELPPGLDVTAYRLVQEALTNAVKYAGGARTDVLLRWTPETLELTVVDRGAGRPPDHNLAPGGHGLIGMQERVRLYGGELLTGRRRSGGFEVHARLPLQPEEAVA